MTETRNIIGTSEEAFRIGLSGPAIYQGTADPTVTPPTPVDPAGFNNGDVYFRTLTGSESIWQFKSGGWVESGLMFFSSSITLGAGAQILADPSAGPGAPAYSFDTDPDTGIFLPSPDTIGFSVGGTPVFNIEADGTLNALTASYETLVLADNDIPNKKYTDDTFFPILGGTLGGDLVVDTGFVVELDETAAAGAPPLTFTGDLDTGVFRPLANTVGLSVGGAEIARVDSTGLFVTTGNQFFGQTGSSAAPSYAIFGASTGWNFDGSNLVQVIGGVDRLTLSTTVLSGDIIFRAADGTTVLPGLAFNSETGTGVFRAAGDIGMSTMGVEQMRIADADGVMTMGNLATNETFTVTIFGGPGAGALFTPGGPGDAFTGDNPTIGAFYVWYDVSGGNVDPLLGGTAITVPITAADSDTVVAAATAAAMTAAFAVEFASVGSVGPLVTVPAATPGAATDAAVATMPPGTLVITTVQGSLGYESFVSAFSNDVPNVIYVENNFLNLTGGTLSGPLTMSSVQFLASSGSQASPSISFAAAADTGLYFASGNNIGFSVDGSFTMVVGDTFVSFDTDVRVLISDGSLVNPSIKFNTDPDNGLFLSAADTTGFVSAGAEVVTVSPTGLAVNNVNATEIFQLPSYTLATLPAVSAGGMIFVSDASAGAGRIAYGNTAAAAWIDPQTGIAVA